MTSYYTLGNTELLKLINGDDAGFYGLLWIAYTGLSHSYETYILIAGLGTTYYLLNYSLAQSLFKMLTPSMWAYFGAAILFVAAAYYEGTAAYRLSLNSANQATVIANNSVASQKSAGTTSGNFWQNELRHTIPQLFVFSTAALLIGFDFFNSWWLSFAMWQSIGEKEDSMTAAEGYKVMWLGLAEAVAVIATTEMLSSVAGAALSFWDTENAYSVATVRYPDRDDFVKIGEYVIAWLSVFVIAFAPKYVGFAVLKLPYILGVQFGQEDGGFMIS